MIVGIPHNFMQTVETKQGEYVLIIMLRCEGERGEREGEERKRRGEER